MNKERILNFLQKKREEQQTKAEKWITRLNQKLTESEYYEARIHYNDHDAMFEVYDLIIHEINMGKFDE